MLNVKGTAILPAMELSDEVGPSAESDSDQAGAWRREFEFPGNVASVAESRERVMEFVCQHCPDGGDRIDILVALQEALANAALHGCGDDAAKRIECSVEASASEIAISVCDPGPGFDLTLADPDNCAATERSNGRGICLMRSLMTAVEFGHGGSEIKLRKLLQRA